MTKKNQKKSTTKSTTNKVPLYYSYLNIVATKSSLTVIARTMKRDKSNTRKALLQLTRKGLVVQAGKHWYLTSKGKKSTTLGRPPPQSTTFVTEKGIETRPHHLLIAVTHREDEFSWRNNFQGMRVAERVPALNEVFNFRFTTKAVQFDLSMPKSRNLINDVSLIHQKVAKVASFLRRRYKVKLVRPSDLGIKQLYSELAYLKSSWAEKEIGSGRRIWLYNWEGDGKPRVLFDKSKNKAELELVGVTVDDDTIETADFLVNLNKGRVREALKDVEAMKAYVPEIHEVLTTIAKHHLTAVPSAPFVVEKTAGRLNALYADDKLREWFNKASKVQKDDYLCLVGVPQEKKLELEGGKE